MKIAVLRQHPAALGGAETTLGHLVEGLVAAGHEVAVYGSEPESLALPAFCPGCRYVRVPVWGGKAGRLLSYAVNCRRLLQQTGDQVVFSLERVPGAQVYRAGDGCHREWLERRTPVLSLPSRAAQRLSPFHRVMLGLEMRLFAHPRLQRIIANSRQVKTEIIRHYSQDPGRIQVIHNGLDRTRFFPLDAGARAAAQVRLGVPPGAPRILFVGSGFKRKGLAYLIEALGTMADQKYLLWVVGKGNPAPYLRQAQRLGVAGRIRFWGARYEVAPFYQVASVLALPTLYDPCSNVVLEALGCGTPVVTTAANGAAEFIIAGRNGAILAQPEDTASLAAACAAWAGQGWDQQVRRAAQEAVAPLSWEDTLSRTRAVLQEAAANL